MRVCTHTHKHTRQAVPITDHIIHVNYAINLLQVGELNYTISKHSLVHILLVVIPCIHLQGLDRGLHMVRVLVC